MAVSLSTAARNAACNAIVDLIDAGASAGQLVIEAGTVEIATLTFSDPAFGNAASGVATANSIASDTNATGGTADSFSARDSDGNIIFEGSAGTSGSGADLIISSTNIGAGDTVSVETMTFTVPAS